MLTNYMKPSVKILGLAQLINSGRPGFCGCYRVASLGTVLAIEFFDAVKRKKQTGMKKIGILPYQTSRIAELSLVHNQEVISGEFTGCIMSVYKKNGILNAAHIDTNTTTSKRMEYENQKINKKIMVVDDYDTVGKIQLANRIILCIANKVQVKNYVVEKGSHSSHKKVPVPGSPGEFQTGQIGETIYTIIKEIG